MFRIGTKNTGHSKLKNVSEIYMEISKHYNTVKSVKLKLIETKK